MIKGFYFDGKTSNKQEVVLYCKHDGLIGFTNLDVDEVPVNTVVISARVSNTPRYINFPDGSQFETTDNDAMDKIAQQFSPSFFNGLIHKLESAKLIVATTTVSLVVFGWLFIQYGIPYSSKVIAKQLPIKASQYLGQGVLDIMDRQWFKKTKLDAKRQAELQKLFTQLKITIEDSEHLKLLFREGGPIGANAFALPDGSIVFTDELIALTENNLEIASIMLHEIGHINERHSLRAAIQKSSLAIFIVAVTGDVSTSSSIITAIPYVLVESGFSKEMETEADGFALQYMQQHNIKPAHFANMMEKLVASFSDHYDDCMSDLQDKLDNKQKLKPEERYKCIAIAVKKNKLTANNQDKNLLDYFSTHPRSEERINRFRQPVPFKQH